MNALSLNLALLLSRPEDRSGGGFGFFLVLAIIGIVLFLVLRGRQDRAEALGTAKAAMPSGAVAGHTFANPYAKCPGCGAAADKMRQSWDGLRKVTWTCGYCGTVAGVQELKDEELPPGARARLGLDVPPQGMVPGPQGYYPPQGGGMGGLLTGMMLGEMLGGERRYPRDDGGWSGGEGQGGPGNDWGESDPGGGDSGGGDWGDSGGGDSGGGDSGGGDF